MAACMSYLNILHTCYCNSFHYII